MDLAKRIRATGEYTGRVDKRKRPVCKVKCQGRGEYILSDADLTGVDYSKTKRGTELFFHAACREKVWRHGIV